MSRELERRYAALLRAYPDAYRRERGDELLGTLLDGARPQQRWPGAREAAHLVLAGWRARSGTDTVLTSREVWARSLQLAVLTLLLYRATADLVQAIGPLAWIAYPESARLARTETAAAALQLLAVPFLLRGRFLLALVPVLAAFTGRMAVGVEAQNLREALRVDGLGVVRDWLTYGVGWQTLAAGGGLVLLATVLRPARRRLSPGWTVALVPVVLLLATPGLAIFLEYGTLSTLTAYFTVPVLITAGIPIVCVAWAGVDPRVAGAAAWWLAAAGVRLLVLTDFYVHPLHEFFFVSENRLHYVRDRITLLTVPVALVVALWWTRRGIRARARP
jgi:hypothetical protein